MGGLRVKIGEARFERGGDSHPGGRTAETSAPGRPGGTGGADGPVHRLRLRRGRPDSARVPGGVGGAGGGDLSGGLEPPENPPAR